MTRVLFLHPNFPGQFRHPAAGFAADGHDVVFLCQTHYGRSLPGVKRLCLKGALGHETLEAQQLTQQQRTQTLADQYRRGMAQLQAEGWDPEVVISHSGWGCGLHVKELWSNAKHVSYLEWWFDPRSDLLHYDPSNHELRLSPNSAASHWKRNQALALELVAADHVVAPSHWQRAQLPALLQKHCEVIYDGIDQKVFKPAPAARSTRPTLTYGTRGMEPMRAFPQFIRELPALLEQHPGLQVEIAGTDGMNYGGAKPAEGSWGSWARALLDETGVSNRVSWLGHLAPDRYVQWLQGSWCHVYLTHPFVASWSLVEALSCGCALVASDVKPVREFCGEGAAWLVDHRQPGFLGPPVEAVMEGHRWPMRDSEVSRMSRAQSLHQWRRVAGVKVATLA